MAKVWKIAPGQGAEAWEMCLEKGCILIGWRELLDYRKYKDEQEILRALKALRGEGKGNGKGAAKIVWRFAKEIQLGDVVVANKGESTVVGIGLVKSEYLPPNSPKNPSQHEWLVNARLVDWLVDKPLDLHQKYFFVQPTVVPLGPKKCDQIKQAYLKKYPEMKVTLGRLFDGVSATDETDFAGESDIEGLNSEFLTTKTKRSRRLRNKAFHAAKGSCGVCQRNFTAFLGGRGIRVLQVHHRKQLSARDSPAVTKLEDLVVVCANCHLLLHLDPRKTMSVDELWDLLKKDGYLAGT